MQLQNARDGMSTRESERNGQLIALQRQVNLQAAELDKVTVTAEDKSWQNYELNAQLRELSTKHEQMQLESEALLATARAEVARLETTTAQLEQHNHTLLEDYNNLRRKTNEQLAN